MNNPPKKLGSKRLGDITVDGLMWFVAACIFFDVVGQMVWKAF